MNTTTKASNRRRPNGNGISASLYLPSSIFYLPVCLAYLLGCISTGLAQGVSASAQPDILSRIGIEQYLHEQVPLNLPFRDEDGPSS